MDVGSGQGRGEMAIEGNVIDNVIGTGIGIGKEGKER
jgi:hypothetical protein